MDVSQLIQQKLTELGLDQRDLADAAQVTESYISQLLSRKKMPPAPERTDIYDKLGRALKLPTGKLAGLADLQRRQELKKKSARTGRKAFADLSLGRMPTQADYSTATVSRFQKEPSTSTDIRSH